MNFLTLRDDEVEPYAHLLARFLAYLPQFVAENHEFATHR
jgi:hypothetical protein